MLGVLLVLLMLSLPAVAEEPTSVSNAVAIDTMWTLIAAFLIFFMQAGFAMVEAGFTRAKNTANILMKNIMDFAAGSLAYYIAGFGIMFGTGTFFFGTGYFLMDGVAKTSMWGGVPTWAFWIFQVVFAATAATIVSGAMAERTKFVSYLIYSFFISLLIYPTVGHWIWGGGWLTTADLFGYLADSPFIDFAGSTVVHSVGGWAALAGAIVLGPRIGKYVKGKVNVIPGHSMTLAALGGFILWFGWFGFNPGSTVAGTAYFDIASIAVTTNLAAAAGAISAMAFVWLTLGKPDISMTINGFLAGLVGITAGCASVSPLSAIAIGAIAGVLVVLAVEFIDKTLKVDDPVGAVSVHGVCGMWGTLAVGLFAQESYGGVDGLFFGGGLSQLITQATGAIAVFLFVFTSAFVLFKTIDTVMGLRVSEQEEIAGLDIFEHGMTAYTDFEIPM